MEKIIKITEPGSLTNLITISEKSSITKLIVQGTINARDFKCMRDDLPLLIDLDLFETTIKGFNGTGGTFYWTENYSYIDDEIPIHCFLRLNFPSNMEDNRRSESNLTKLVLPNTITSIADSAFTYHSGLKEIIIPDSVIKIGVGSFEKCTGLEFLSIGNNMDRLGSQSFMDCKNLKTIIIKTVTPPKSDSLTFYGSYNHTFEYNCPMVYVPDQSIDVYNNTGGFNYYRSYKHPQTGNYIIGITGLTAYQGTIDTPVNPTVTPTDPPVDVKYEITINYGRNGRIEMYGKRLINNKTLIINPNTLFNIVPNKNYKIDTVRYNDIDVNPEIINNQYKPTLLTEKSALNVTFKKKKTSWNKDELISMLLKLKNTISKDDNVNIEKFIEENT